MYLGKPACRVKQSLRQRLIGIEGFPPTLRTIAGTEAFHRPKPRELPGHEGHATVSGGFQKARLDVGMANGGSLPHRLQKGVAAYWIEADFPTVARIIENLQFNLSPEAKMHCRIKGTRFPGP